MKMANYYNRMFLLSPYKYSYKHKKPRRRPPHLRKPPTGLLISYQLAARSWLNKSFCFSVNEVGIFTLYVTIMSPN